MNNSRRNSITQALEVPQRTCGLFNAESRARLDSAQIALEAAIELLTYSLETGADTARRNAYAALRLAESKLAAASADYEDFLMDRGMISGCSR